MVTQEQIPQVRRSAVVDRDGVKVGTVADVYLDDDTQRPTWATVATGLLGTRVRFAPLSGATYVSGQVQLATTRDAVLAAPRFTEDEYLDAHEESALIDHYRSADLASGLSHPSGSTKVAPSWPLGAPPHLDDPDELLRQAVTAIRAAREAQAHLDPTADGSNLDELSPGLLINAPHPAAPRVESKGVSQTRDALIGGGPDVYADAPGSVDARPGDEPSPAEQRRREADAQARQAHWAREHGVPFTDDESDL